MYYSREFDITVIASFVILSYGLFIYLLLSLVNISVENILLVSILTSSCIISYDITMRFCDVMFYLHLKERDVKKERENP